LEARSCFEDYHTKAQLWNSSGCADGPPSTKQGPQTRNVSKRSGIISNIFEIYFFYIGTTNFYCRFQTRWNMSVLLPTNCHLFYHVILLRSHDIIFFSDRCAKV
jgi:hypothetical protein